MNNFCKRILIYTDTLISTSIAAYFYFYNYFDSSISQSKIDLNCLLCIYASYIKDIDLISHGDVDLIRVILGVIGNRPLKHDWD